MFHSTPILRLRERPYVIVIVNAATWLEADEKGEHVSAACPLSIIGNQITRLVLGQKPDHVRIETSRF